MYFSFELHDQDMPGELLYIQDEYSLLYEPFNSAVGVSIICGSYTSLDTVLETGLIAHISGYNSKRLWLATDKAIPKSVKGQIRAHFDDLPQKGTGIDYDRSWKTYYNKQDTCLCLGDDSALDDDKCIEFANGIVAVIRGSDLVAIWAKIREVW